MDENPAKVMGSNPIRSTSLLVDKYDFFIIVDMEELDDPLILFKDALPNALTRNRYEKQLNNFFKFLTLEGDTLQSRSELC